MKLRAHHGMCLAFFEGKGYNNAFTENMAKIQADMKKDTVLTIIDGADVICHSCPRLQEEVCSGQEQTGTYDRKVLAYCGIEQNAILTWQAFSALISERIFRAGKRKEICGSCGWSYLCDKKEVDMHMD